MHFMPDVSCFIIQTSHFRELNSQRTDAICISLYWWSVHYIDEYIYVLHDSLNKAIDSLTIFKYCCKQYKIPSYPHSLPQSNKKQGVCLASKYFLQPYWPCSLYLYLCLLLLLITIPLSLPYPFRQQDVKEYYHPISDTCIS